MRPQQAAYIHKRANFFFSILCCSLSPSSSYVSGKQKLRKRGNLSLRLGSLTQTQRKKTQYLLKRYRQVCKVTRSLCPGCFFQRRQEKKQPEVCGPVASSKVGKKQSEVCGPVAFSRIVVGATRSLRPGVTQRACSSLNK